MKPRSERRREERRGGALRATVSAVASSGLIIAGLIGVGVAIIVVAIVLLAQGGDGDGDVENQVEVFPDGSTPIPVVAASNEDERALEELAERLIDWLPQGKWPDLYDDFTDAFRERCSREAFVASGNTSAQEQGDQLTLIRYGGVKEFSVQETTASLVIVGQLGVIRQYTVGADFEKTGDTWQISPVEGSTGCDAFSRLSG